MFSAIDRNPLQFGFTLAIALLLIAVWGINRQFAPASAPAAPTVSATRMTTVLACVRDAEAKGVRTSAAVDLCVAAYPDPTR